MCLIKLAAYATAGVLTYRSIARVSTVVKECATPKGTALAKLKEKGHYVDTFKAAIPKQAGWWLVV